ncbi:hypothetical protein [Cellulomonas taurus]|uniref:hypothetical protein n=1 Tax=Cellulomonas taurus TaxID=2729175 RepID=UPI00145D5E2B|nr:hypothetical protein [Cellulomonas taurus]
MSVFYRPDPVIAGVELLLAGALPDKVGGRDLAIEVDAAQWTIPQVTIEQVGGPTPTSIHFGGHDWAVLTLQLSSIGADRRQARLIGDHVREAITGQDRHGRPLHPLTVPGAAVLETRSQNDGHIAQDNPAKWVETFEIRYQGA